MTSVNMDVEKYLSRIGCAAPAGPTLDTLQSLHTRHLLSVPFEDLTIHSGGQIKLDLPLLYEKIVNQHRGGFCYENNGLFSWLLTQLGFQVTLLAGQVKGITGCYGPPLDHLILMVVIQGRNYLCDVGFGDAGFSSPLLLDTSEPQVQGHRLYRITKRTMDMYYVEWKIVESQNQDWMEMYKFTLEPRSFEDFTDMCQYHQTSPHSIFFCKSCCTLLKPGGRVTYIGWRLITKTFPTEATGGLVETMTRELKEEEIPQILAENFGIVLSSPLKPKDDTVTPPLV